MFTYHTKETAPDASKPIIEQSQKIFGTVPNLHQILAEAPTTYALYNEAFDSLMKTSLTPLEQQVVMMAANYENRCHFCMAGHSFMMKSLKMPADVIEALREGQTLSDPKLEALKVFVVRLIENRGHIGDDKLQEFLDAGFTKQQALEVLSGMAAKLISNYTNALAHTELDKIIQPYVWVHPDDRV